MAKFKVGDLVVGIIGDFSFYYKVEDIVEGEYSLSTVSKKNPENEGYVWFLESIETMDTNFKLAPCSQFDKDLQELLDE
jgi:hypothetical protein